ncbi:MAG: glucosaminidase domain-containing protein [Roseburia sp.]|nr:glucosaminidase domain-containing protein [Roseburia sp.]
MLISVTSYAYNPASVLAYIAQYKDIALTHEKEYGIPASITLAQGILESGAGTSSLTKASNNHFGIKAGNGWSGRVHLAWDDETVKSRFRCYSSPEESFRDHAKLLSTSKYYRNLFKINIYDYRGWAYGLKKAGYATSPTYAQALIGLIDHYKLYTINGGAKLRPGKTVMITTYKDIVKPVIEEDNIIPDDEVTEEEASVVKAINHYVTEINDIHCTIIQPGEDLASISRKYDIAPSDLMNYNELATENQAKEGDIIFLDKKKKKYTGSQDLYIAKGGESLHDISQSFGIQLKQLAKLNNMSEYSLLNKGTRIYLK